MTIITIISQYIQNIIIISGLMTCDDWEDIPDIIMILSWDILG